MKNKYYYLIVNIIGEEKYIAIGLLQKESLNSFKATIRASNPKFQTSYYGLAYANKVRESMKGKELKFLHVEDDFTLTYGDTSLLQLCYRNLFKCNSEATYNYMRKLGYILKQHIDNNDVIYFEGRPLDDIEFKDYDDNFAIILESRIYYSSDPELDDGYYDPIEYHNDTWLSYIGFVPNFAIKSILPELKDI